MRKPNLAPKKSTDWDTTLKAIGYTLHSHTMRIAMTKGLPQLSDCTHNTVHVADRMLHEHEVLNMAGKLWSLTYVVRAGTHFVWQLLRLTGLDAG